MRFNIIKKTKYVNRQGICLLDSKGRSTFFFGTDISYLDGSNEISLNFVIDVEFYGIGIIDNDGVITNKKMFRETNNFESLKLLKGESFTFEASELIGESK
jgi:hypothetical protein